MVAVGVGMNHLTIDELQQYGRLGNEEALLELGRKVLEFDFCMGGKTYCCHMDALVEIQTALEFEMPPECPHCDKWLTDH